MSQNTSQEKTEKPTPKRLRDARKKGEIARSRELASFVVVTSGALAVWLFGPLFAQGGLAWMRAALSPDPELLAAPGDLAAHLAAVTAAGFAVALPLLAVGVIAAIIGPLLMGGWNLSAEALQPKLERLNPLSGLKRIFSTQALVELAKAVLKALLLGAIAAAFIWASLDALLALPRLPLAAGLAQSFGLMVGGLLAVCGGLLVIALIDAPWQRHAHEKKLRMTKDEVRRELKETEGSPEVKGRQRRIQQELASARMMEAVPGADVVLTNPTHYAVALRYDPATMRAPQLVAKGRDLVAATIREIAQRHGVPLVAAPPLARALYRQGRLSAEIPPALYLAVAQVLTYLHQLRQWQAQARRAGTPPAPPVFDHLPGGEPDEKPT